MIPIPVTTADPDPLLRAEEVAALLGGIHPRTVGRLAERGELAHVRAGRLRLYRASHVDAYLAAATAVVTR